MYWYISIPLIIGCYIFYKWLSRPEKFKDNSNTKRADRTYYDPNYKEHQDHTNNDSGYTWSEQRQYYNSGYNSDSKYEYNAYSDRRKYNRSRKSSLNREQRIQNRLTEFNITQDEAKIIFGKAWRSKLAMYDWRLYFVIKQIEIHVTYDTNGRYRRKYGSLYNKVLSIIQINKDTNPDLEDDFQQRAANSDNYNEEYQEDYQHEENEGDANSEEYTQDQTFESQNDDITCAFQVLGLKTSATHDEIKKRYKELILKFHPDRNKSANATTKTREIIAAYELIMKTAQEA